VGQGGKIVPFAALPEQFVDVRGMHLEDAGNLLNSAEVLVHGLNDALPEFQRIGLHAMNLPVLPSSFKRKPL
jgi:hypothetical protein